MQKIRLLTFLVFSCFLASAQEYKKMIAKETFTVQQIKEIADAYFSERGKGKGTGHKQYKRWEYNALRMQNENGYLKTPSFYIEELARYNAYLNTKNQNKSVAANDNWEKL
ncbi:MAG: hypothetical protein COA88_01660 [Kordia sp.]|nr:MAG: hypothetical protein COA88_01660 [Kordia sp.]